jgi:hypothetical protein
MRDHCLSDGPIRLVETFDKGDFVSSIRIKRAAITGVALAGLAGAGLALAPAAGAASASSSDVGAPAVGQVRVCNLSTGLKAAMELAAPTNASSQVIQPGDCSQWLPTVARQEVSVLRGKDRDHLRFIGSFWANGTREEIQVFGANSVVEWGIK